MTLGHGPKIVRNGLVFAYDMPLNGASSSNKSWKGAPVTNVVLNTDLNTGWSQGYNTSIQWNDYPPPNGINSPVVSFIDADGNGSGYWYSYGDYATQEPSTTYAISIWCRTLGSDWTIRAYTADNSETGRQNTNNVTIPGDGKWYRAEFNPITTPADTQSDSLSFIFPIIPAGQRVWLCAPQMTATNYHVPFVSGTRSNTQALLDWKSNNTITVNNLTYESDGTFSFNGSTDYATLSSSVDTYQKSFTLDAWVYSNSTSGFKGIIGDYQYYWFQFAVNGSSPYLRYGYYVNGSETRMTLDGTSGKVPANTWTNITAVMENGVGTKLYVNGVLDVSNTNGNSFGISGTSRGPRYIGRADSSSFGTSPNWFNGKIGSLKAYSGVALTAEEVAQNFNAHRGRYGL